ncbi:MAG: hypothetical protein ABI262_14735, partial [Microcoleus sp.]
MAIDFSIVGRKLPDRIPNPTDWCVLQESIMMRQDSAEYQTVEACDENCYPDASFRQPESAGADAGEEVEPIWFHTHFEDSMEMYADAATVAEHLNNHKSWFCQCASP